MKFSMTFSDLSVREAQRLFKFGAEELPLPESLVEKRDEQPQKPRRRRRTKEQMAEARAQEQAEEDADARRPDDWTIEEDKPKRRRRRRATPRDEGPASQGEDEGPASQSEDDPPVPKHTLRRRRRRSAPEEDPSSSTRRRGRASSSEEKEDEITDRDVSKAASDGAQELTPAAVRSILDQFAVANVGDLDQGQRREFIDMVEKAVEDSDLDGDEIPF